MPAFSFIHVSDLHLDTPFRGLSAAPPAIAEVIQNATLDAFESLVRLAIEQDAAFLIVSGDAIDGADRNLRAQRIFRDGLARLASRGIQSFVAFGNADSLEAWSATLDWPEGVRLFRAGEPESVVASRHGVPLARLAGVSYAHPAEERNLARQFQAEPPGGLYQIAVLHANCGGQPGHAPCAPCTLEDLTRAGFDYWALGHPHRPAMLSESPAVACPGTLQGRAFSEAGPHGAVLVTVGGDRKARVEFVPVDTVRWETAEIGIEGLGSAAGLGQAISQALERLRQAGEGRVVLARLRLTGQGPLYYELSRANLARQLLEQARKIGTAEDPAVWVEAIELECQPEIDLERRSRGRDLLGQVLTAARELREGGLEEQLGAVLAPLFQEGQARHALEPLAPEDLESILAAAERLCLDQLEKTL